MGGLFSRSEPGKIIGKSIVDILTTNEYSTSVVTCRKGRFIPDIIGINSVLQGHPKRLGNGWHERGLVNPEETSALYLIDAEKKVLGRIHNEIDLFYDSDKVREENKFMWHGAFQEVLEQFQRRGYHIRNI